LYLLEILTNESIVSGGFLFKNTSMDLVKFLMNSLFFKIKEKGHTKLHSLQNIQTSLDFLKSYKVIINCLKSAYLQRILMNET
jgi:hypothetical protein